jgi:L-ascorbate metabolism protein UlaG (beta-lactamase superfamily)
MADDPDQLFPSGATTRRGLFASFSRRAVEAMPVPDALAPRPAALPFDDFPEEEAPDWIEPAVAGELLVEDVMASLRDPGLHVWWLGQSGFLVQTGGQNIVFDPFLSDWLIEHGDGTGTPHERITGVVAEPSLLSFVDVVTSSHAHLDHLDPGTLPGILSGDAAFVCAAGSEDVAAERAGRRPTAGLRVGEHTMVGDLWIEAVPAYHDGAPEAVGYVAFNRLHSIYHAGDTIRVQGMAESVAPHGVDVAFVPVNGQNGNMDGADAARLAYEAGAMVAVPCHYEMFRHNTASTSRFVAECVRLGLEYRLPRVGERFTLGADSWV